MILISVFMRKLLVIDAPTLRELGERLGEERFGHLEDSEGLSLVKRFLDNYLIGTGIFNVFGDEIKPCVRLRKVPLDQRVECSYGKILIPWGVKGVVKYRGKLSLPRNFSDYSNIRDRPNSLGFRFGYEGTEMDRAATLTWKDRLWRRKFFISFVSP